jgi:hypothetical protein
MTGEPKRPSPAGGPLERDRIESALLVVDEDIVAIDNQIAAFRAIAGSPAATGHDPQPYLGGQGTGGRWPGISAPGPH